MPDGDTTELPLRRRLEGQNPTLVITDVAYTS